MRNIDVIKRSKLYVIIGTAFTLLAVVGLLFKGLNYGIDFAGGNLFQIKYEKEVTLPEINKGLDLQAQSLKQLDSRSRKVQLSEGNVVIIRTQEMSEDEKGVFLENMKTLGNYSLEKSEKVGASVGKDLKKLQYILL